ncbi:hypothetical protein BBOV_II007290 [Babesia bovis T2Bo]|uniref:hypothetical protein n=1 Tax=Babesia bovis T2Bo TaxID=484906 RepID=UPI001C368411|nr:hypothetical protein BBOV_II007290 [Babesia bovis T2Bo]EDO06679.2 hypothetical protein BBOV_II007290 [Babesia bovis T2Bo]
MSIRVLGCVDMASIGDTVNTDCEYYPSVCIIRMSDICRDVSTDDAIFSLVHITSPEILQPRYFNSKFRQEAQTDVNLSVNVNVWLGKSRDISSIDVVQGSILAIGVVVRPKDSVHDLDAWVAKYRSLEVKVDIPSANDSSLIKVVKRDDRPATSVPSLKYSFLCIHEDTYWLHTTFDTIVLPTYLLERVIPIIAYVNPLEGTACVLPSIKLVGEMFVRNIMAIDVSIMDQFAQVKLSNKDDNCTIEVEDLLLTCADYRLAEGVLPLTLGRKQDIHVVLTSDYPERLYKRDELDSLFLKWHIKGQPGEVRHIWSIVATKKAASLQMYQLAAEGNRL